MRIQVRRIRISKPEEVSWPVVLDEGGLGAEALPAVHALVELLPGYEPWGGQLTN